MTKQLNHGSICGRIFAHMLNHPAKPKVSEQQEVILLDMLDGLTREDLRIGQPLQLEFQTFDGEMTLPMFRPVVGQGA